jgi:cytochrome c oxidase cbb3-type subunit IV
MMNYENLRDFAASWGTLYFALIFVAVLTFALWPSNAKKFDEAAQIPLRED